METKEIESSVNTKLAEWGIEYSAVFVPFSASRNKAEKNPSLNWLVRFTQVPIEDTGRTFATDYAEGIGHVPGYDFKYARSLDGDAMYRNIAEDGRMRKPEDSDRLMPPRRAALPAPTATSALSCLLMDAEAFGFTFEEWASEFGYDTDSRKAEATYRECVSTSMGIMRVFTPAQLTELRELMEDY